MPVSSKIDFDDVYEIEQTSDKSRCLFKTELIDGTSDIIHIKISTEEHEILRNVYNLAFGPLNKKGQIDDLAKLSHANYSKVFSTIILHAREYLYNHSSHLLGIDGSTYARAYLYYRLIQKNYIYLSKYFKIFGIKHYVRITRFGKNQYDDPFDFNDIRSYSEQIIKDTKFNQEHMFNYFILELK